MLKIVRNFITENISFKTKKRMYTFLSRVPLLRMMLKKYVQKNNPVYLVSFPKCGRTWLRVMLGKVLQIHFNLEDTADILTVSGSKKKFPGFPGVLFVHDDSAHWKKPDELEKSKQYYKFRKVIFLVREPKDAAVSMYFEKNKRVSAYVDGEKLEHPDSVERIEPYNGSLSEYLYEPVGSIDTIISFYNIWADNRNVPEEFLLVRYEDIHENPKRELRRVLDFIGMKAISDNIIAEAVNFSSFDKMHSMEKKNKGKTVILRPVDKDDPESYKTRKGKVGGFIEYLNDEEIEYLNNNIKDNLTDYYRYD